MCSRLNTVTYDNNIKEKIINYKERVLEQLKGRGTAFFTKVSSFKKQMNST